MKKLLASLGVVALVSVGCSAATTHEMSAPGASAPNHHGPAFQVGEPPKEMPAELRKFWGPVVNPPGIPQPPADVIKNGMRPARDMPITGSGSTQACYPAGHQANPTNVCKNPNMISPDGPNTTNYTQWLHWHNEPYFNPPTGIRYVWVMDSLVTTRASEWLQYWVTTMNNYYYNPPPGEQVGDRPYYLYYQVEQFGWTPGPCYLTASTHPQWIDFCGTTTGPYASWFFGTESHFTFVQARINESYAITNDMYLGYEVLHEGGHSHGFHHNQDCASPMTYCSVVGNQYILGYAWDDHRAYELLYDSHPAGTKDGVG